MRKQPRKHQKLCLDAMWKALNKSADPILLDLTVGFGKCHGKDTPILMHDGSLKMVQDVSVGDLVMGTDSNPREVINTTRGIDDLYQVDQVNGDSYIVNSHHLLSLKVSMCDTVTDINGVRSYKGDVVNVRVTDYLKSNKTFQRSCIGYKGQVDFEHRDNFIISPYEFGLWLGDGSYGCNSITTMDDEISSAWVEMAKRFECKVRVATKENNKAATFFLPNAVKGFNKKNPITKEFRRLCPNGKRIHSDYLTSSKKQRLELLAGLIDTDGTLVKKTVYEITQKSEPLIDDITFLARSVGLRVRKKMVEKGIKSTGFSGTYYRLHISGNTNLVPCRLERKIANPRKQKKDPLVSSISVKPIGKGEFFGFQLSGKDNLYMLGDFTVTHNSLICAWVAESLQNSGRTNLVLTMTSDLVDQNSDEFRKIGPMPYEPAVMCSKLGMDTWRRPVLFATPQSLWAKIKSGHPVSSRSFDLITIDECFSGDTLIKTEDGELRIDDPRLVDKEILCFCEVTHNVYYHKPVRVLHNGVRFTSQIKTKHGEVKCTSTHLFFTGESWVKAENLKAGQKIALDGSSDFVLIKANRAAVAVVKELFRSVLRGIQVFTSRFHHS